MSGPEMGTGTPDPGVVVIVPTIIIKYIMVSRNLITFFNWVFLTLLLDRHYKEALVYFRKNKYHTPNLR